MEKGQPETQATAEFGERVYYRTYLKGKANGEKLESRWGGGFLGKFWRTGEAIVGSKESVNLQGPIGDGAPKDAA